jgi:hypothetical protein
MHGNLKTIQSITEAKVDFAALVNPTRIHFAIINLQKADDLCVKQTILTISTFAVITKVGKTDIFQKPTTIFNEPYLCLRCSDFGYLNCTKKT